VLQSFERLARFSATTRGRMMGDVEGNKAVIRRFVEEVQNNKNWDVYDELNAEDFVNHSAPPGVPNDREGGKMYLGAFMGAFPDCHFTIDDMIAEGDQVVTKKTFTGTHTAELNGIPPTGKRVTLQFADIMRVRNGKIVEHWLTMDQLSFMQQLGVLPI
jgi:predicted ester cyclase